MKLPLLQLSKVYNNLKKNINELELFYTKLIDEISPFIDEIEQEEKDFKLTMDFLIWAMIELKNIDILSSFKESYNRLKQSGRYFPTYSPTRNKHTKESIAYIDNINTYLKYLNQNVDIGIPSIVLNDRNNYEISINSVGNKLSTFFESMNFYLLRIDNYINTINNIRSDNNLNQRIETWQKLLVQNDFEKLLNIMSTFFQTNGNLNSYKKCILLQQRLYRNQNEFNKVIISQEYFSLEQNKITSSIIDLFFLK